MGSIGSNLQEVKRRVAAACAVASRDANTVTLLAVSKTFGAEAVREAHAAGARAFGENYVQEALAKITALADLRHAAPGDAVRRPQRHGIEWHLIGPLQSNKTRAVAEAFDWVHTVDRLKIAERLAAQRPVSLPPLDVCLQVNVSDEASKSGVDAPALPALALQVAALPAQSLRLRGLMSIPEPTDDIALQRQQHRRLRALFDEVRAALATRGPAAAATRFDTLSMGMSEDLEAAIAEGATIVRVGRAIFGTRG